MAAVTGTGASTFGNMVGNASGFTEVTGTGAATFGDLKGAGAGMTSVVGNGSASFGDMRAFAYARVSNPVGPADNYFYTTLPGIIPAPFPGDAMKAGPPLIMNPRVLLEHQIFDLRIVAYRADLVDGRRVFRTTRFFLQRMRKDAGGYFIEIANVKYYWTPENPVTANDAFFHEWGPL